MLLQPGLQVGEPLRSLDCLWLCHVHVLYWIDLWQGIAIVLLHTLQWRTHNQVTSDGGGKSLWSQDLMLQSWAWQASLTSVRFYMRNLARAVISCWDLCCLRF